MNFSDLPAIGAQLEGGSFQGVIAQPDGMHVAVALLPDQASEVTWTDAIKWAESIGGVLPTRPIAALLFANCKPLLRPQWHWTSEAYDASYAWGCYFFLGTQCLTLKSYEGCAVAVRLIPLSA